jgi:hypothetical protein
MHALGKYPSAKLSVLATAMARPWAGVCPHRLAFLLSGDDPENRLVEEIPAEGFGGRRHAVHVLCFIKRAWKIPKNVLTSDGTGAMMLVGTAIQCRLLSS